MWYLLTASLLWAFSFGLIKQQLTGLDSGAVACVRLALSLLIFLPFCRPGLIPPGRMIKLATIGAIQYGVMYTAYIRSYHYLESYQVALLTVFTPIFVTFINDAMEKKFKRHSLTAAAIAVLGGAIIFWKQGALNAPWRGILLMQTANICFAFGQVAYRRMTLSEEVALSNDAANFSFLYLGAVVFTLAVTTAAGGWHGFAPSRTQLAALLYLGILPSGIGFFLWNCGARRTPPAVLAVFNNLKIPLAVSVSLLVFNETTDIPRLLAGGLILIAALGIGNKAES